MSQLYPSDLCLRTKSFHMQRSDKFSDGFAVKTWAEITFGRQTGKERSCFWLINRVRCIKRSGNWSLGTPQNRRTEKWPDISTVSISLYLLTPNSNWCRRQLILKLSLSRRRNVIVNSALESFNPQRFGWHFNLFGVSTRSGDKLSGMFELHLSTTGLHKFPQHLKICNVPPKFWQWSLPTNYTSDWVASQRDMPVTRNYP